MNTSQSSSKCIKPLETWSDIILLKSHGCKAQIYAAATAICSQISPCLKPYCLVPLKFPLLLRHVYWLWLPSIPVFCVSAAHSPRSLQLSLQLLTLFMPEAHSQHSAAHRVLGASPVCAIEWKSPQSGQRNMTSVQSTGYRRENVQARANDSLEALFSPLSF